MERRPDFERLRTALFLHEPDRVPLADAYVHRDVKEAFMGRPVTDLKGEVEFWAGAGYDFVPLLAGLLRRGTLPREANVRGTSRYSVYQQGTVSRNWAAEGKGAITSHELFERFPWPDPDRLDYSEYEAVRSLMPAGMKAIAAMGNVFDAVWRLMGTETFFYSLMDDPALVERMFERVGSLQYQVILRILEFDSVGAVWMGDDIAYTEGLLVSPALLRRHVFPWFKKIGEACKAKGLPYLYHTDGNVSAVLEDIIEIGFNALHPIEPKAMEINALKRSVGDRLCLIGNIDLGYTLTLGTPQEVEAEVKERIRTLAPGGGYCVSSSNSITEYVPLENFRAMIEATFRYGRYPIRL